MFSFKAISDGDDIVSILKPESEHYETTSAAKIMECPVNEELIILIVKLFTRK